MISNEALHMALQRHELGASPPESSLKGGGETSSALRYRLSVDTAE